MKFITQQKEYEIEPKSTISLNGKTVPTFTLKISKPFALVAVFSAHDITTRQRTEGVKFYSGSELAKMLKSKQDVLFSLTPEAIAYVKDEAEKTIASIVRESQKQNVEKWYWAIGGDSHALYVAADIDTEFRPELRDIAETVEKTRARGNIWQLLRDKSTLSDRKTALYTDGWFEISNDDMMEIYNIIIAKEDEVGKIEKAKQERREEEKQAIFETAKTTGEKQILYKMYDECDDPREECSMDEIIAYAMPDGTIKIARNHTY